LVTTPVRAGDADPKIDEAQSKLLLVLLDEAKVPERTAAVAELAAFDKPASARALLDALDKLSARTVQAETRAVRTRQDYERYKGAAQSSDKDWQMKTRLLEQMEHDDAILRGDAAVFDAIGAAVATLKDKESVSLLDKAAVKAELVPTRRVLDAALLRNPAANAKEIAKRASADSDASVRLAALLAFADRKDVALLDFALRALSDPAWTFRQAAARALAAIGDAKAIGPLVTCMAGEDGSVLEDYAAALTKLTGALLGPNPDAWKRWYDDHKAELAAKGAPPAAPKPTAN
jgi:hypothetical protein